MPVSATNLKLHAKDMKLASKQVAKFNLPDPAKYAKAAAARPKTAAPAAQSAPPQAAAAPAASASSKGARKVKVGAIEHALNNVEMLKEIPASRLTGRWKEMNRSAPAPKGLVWYYLQGTATNKDKSPRTVTVDSVVIVDEKNTAHVTENDKIMYYVDPQKILSVVRMKPGESGAWETYIAAPPVEKGTRLRVTDLKYKSRRFGYLALTTDGPSGPPAGAKSASVAAPKTPPHTTKPAPRPVSKQPSPSKPKTSKPAPPAVLTKMDHKERGFSILIPKGSEVALKTKGNIVYQYKKPPQFYQVSVLDNPGGGFEGAEKMATANGVKKIKSKKKIDNGLLLITEPFGVMQDVWIFKNGNKKKLIANCMGSKNGFKDLMRMCQSLVVD